MDDGESRCPPFGGIEITVDDAAWRRAVPGAEAIARRALASAGIGAHVVLADDRTVCRLNLRHRGKNKPTNVLSFPPAAASVPGEIVLALGTVRREARAARRRPGYHLAHLVIHGALHLQGEDHHHPGAARRMEMREARLLARARIPSPWRPR